MLEPNEISTKFELDRSKPFDISTHNPVPGVPVHNTIANQILADVMQFRRHSGLQTTCASSPCSKCREPHLPKIAEAVAQGQPVTFVLPAFPGKSPNPTKVLGNLPDMAERCALEFLQHLCDRIKKYYSPGARLILCSDGRVFSDVVGLRDEDVTAYQRELSRIISESGLASISTFGLDDVYGDLAFDQMRARLMEQYGEPLDALKAAVSRGGKNHECTDDDQETNRLYCGMTRFLVEDATFPGQTQSRSSIQRECRNRAYAVIQRSQTWGNWVKTRFPHAVRLSIHPQTCGAKKLGIRLFEDDHWLTPWHGVAVQVGGRFVLLKRSQAEMIGARLVHSQGRPSHYVLADEKELEALQRTEHGT